MSSEPVDPIEQALARAIADPEHRDDFYRTLLESALYVLGAPAPAEAGGDGGFSLIHLEDEEGSVVPVFSSPDRAGALASVEMQCVQVPAIALLSQLRGGRIVLNPGASSTLLFTAEQIDALLEGVMEQEEDGLLLEDPETLPRELTDPLSRLFATHPSVTAAYLVEATEQGGEPRLLIGIDTRDGGDGVRDEAAVLLDAVGGGQAVDVVVLADDPLSEYLRTEVEPFHGTSPVTAIDPERLRRLVANPPRWGNSFLGRMFGNAEPGTQIAIGAIVQANNALWTPSDEAVSAPAVIVYSASPERRLDRRWVRRLAGRLGRLRAEDSSDPVDQRLRARLEAEEDWFFETLPAAYTGDGATTWGVVVINTPDLPGGCLPADGLLPLLIGSQSAKKPGELLQILPKADWARGDLG